MTRGTKVLAAIIAVPLLAFAAFWLKYPPYSWQQKLTITVRRRRDREAGRALFACAGATGRQSCPIRRI